MTGPSARRVGCGGRCVVAGGTDGSLVDVSHTGSPLTVDGKAVAFYEVYHDLTQQLRAEATISEQQKLLEAFFTQSLDGFFFMMLDRPIRWNDQADKEKLLITSSPISGSPR